MTYNPDGVTLTGKILQIDNGGLVIDRTGNDPYISFGGDGTGQIRATASAIEITGSGGSPTRFSVDTSTGAVTAQTSVKTPKIFNPDGDLLIMPGVQGNVFLFDGTDVGNDDSGKILYVYRKAPEGNDYMRFYFSANRTGYIHSSNKLTLQGQVEFTINSVTDDIVFKVGDSAGAKKVYFKDSGGTVVSSVDSDGNAQFDGVLSVGTTDDTYVLNLGATDPVIHLINDQTIVGMGYNVGAFEVTAGEGTPSVVGLIRIDATEDWTSTSYPTSMGFFVVPSGSTTGQEVLRLDEDGIDVTGDIVVSGLVDGVDIAALDTDLSNKITGTGILRKIHLWVSNGATPGTNIDVEEWAPSGGEYNPPSFTDATNLAKSGSSGSFTLSANGQNLVLDCGKTVTAVLASNVNADDLESGGGGGYYIRGLVDVSDNLQFAIKKSGTESSQDWTSMTNAGSTGIEFEILFVTSD
jgi:hypothetical protein